MRQYQPRTPKFFIQQLHITLLYIIRFILRIILIRMILVCIAQIFIDATRIVSYNSKEETYLPKKPIELERIIFADGWIFKSQNGSHRQYIHPKKPGKVTIPFHAKELPIKTEKSILKQAGLI